MVSFFNLLRKYPKKLTSVHSKMIKSVFQILCFFAIVISLTVGSPIYECSDGGLIPEEVLVDGCEFTGDICQAPFNGILNMTMKYKAPHYLESITAKLIGKTSWGEVSLAVDEVNACNGILNTLCPLVPQELIEYKYSVRLAVLPLVPLILSFKIVDTVLDETAICFNLDVYPV